MAKKSSKVQAKSPSKIGVLIKEAKTKVKQSIAVSQAQNSKKDTKKK